MIRSYVLALVALALAFSVGSPARSTPSPCDGVNCPAGTGCDPSVGVCKNLCTAVAAPPTCTPPAVCRPETGTCVDRCAGVTCSGATLVCSPTSGNCVQRCSTGQCTAEESCEATTGVCTAKCESVTKPAGKPACGPNLKCQRTTGDCVGFCAEVACPSTQWCDDATGACTHGQAPAGRPGAACSHAGDCHVAFPAAGQVFSCLTSGPGALAFPDGYCTATCDANTACPQGATCLPGLGCIDECTRDADCRNAPQYRCQPLGGGKYGCLPANQCTKAAPSECAPVGGDCTSSGDCVSGASCETETFVDEGTGQSTFSGWDNGSCSWVMRGTDRCPPGSTGVAASQDDPNFQLCLRSCVVADVAGCALGESCLALEQNSDAGICYLESCDVDADCQLAACSASVLTACGRNQTCTNGACHTNDKCTADADCAGGSKCDAATQECFRTFCEPSLGTCLPDCTALDGQGDHSGACANTTCPSGQACTNNTGKCEQSVCREGTVCNASTRRCDRACTGDSDCGANGVCHLSGATGICGAYCTSHNAAKVCAAGEPCASNGHCGQTATGTDGGTPDPSGNADDARAGCGCAGEETGTTALLLIGLVAVALNRRRWMFR